jgi:hypothetical protein
MYGEKCWRTWETREFLMTRCARRKVSAIREKQVGRHETTSREARNNRETDQFVVLRDGRAVHVGKGLTGIRSL